MKYSINSSIFFEAIVELLLNGLSHKKHGKKSNFELHIKGDNNTQVASRGYSLYGLHADSPLTRLPPPQMPCMINDVVRAAPSLTYLHIPLSHATALCLGFLHILNILPRTSHIFIEV